MSSSLLVPPGRPRANFLGWPWVSDLHRLEADVALLGVPYGACYRPGEAANDQSRAPDAIRTQSFQISDGPDHFDFDLGGPLLDGREVRCVDCGNVGADVHDPGVHYRNAEGAVHAILCAGALPLVLGGDHGITTPVLRAYERHGPVTLVHVDAHLDWRDHVNGVREGYSSPIRRASEMPWVKRIVQLGMRGTGSARREEFEAARAWGADILTAYEVHRIGIEAVLARIPAGERYYVSIDADGLDPSEVPAVMAPSPGGLYFRQVRELLHGLVARGTVVGMDVVEVAPSHDVNGISCIVAGRLITNLVGAMARAGCFDKPEARAEVAAR